MRPHPHCPYPTIDVTRPGAERVYGAHCHAGDTIGVLLDCDAGRINYFIDGVKYGEHILNDLGCAFENLSPFGFNADGCGSGGAGQVCNKYSLHYFYAIIFHTSVTHNCFLHFPGGAKRS